MLFIPDAVVPNWYHPVNNSSPVVPCTVTMSQYSLYKNTNSDWYSKPFYTRETGYKLQLKITANGDGSSRGTHVSVLVCLMKGEYDEQLKWPLNANITLQLLNWSQDSNHIQHTVHYNEVPVEHRQLARGLLTADDGWRINEFISHSTLSNNDSSDISYINNDMLCFSISVIVL